MATIEANIGARRTRPSPDWLRAFVASQSKSARSLASTVRREDRLRFSRTVTFHVIAAYWQEYQSESSWRWPYIDAATTAARQGFILISPRSNGSIQTTTAGSFKLPESLERPWLVPRTKSQFKLVRRVEQFPCRLADYGYSVSTGPLVWNRHKTSLRQQPGEGRYPLIWAESVRTDGSFEFRARKRNHQPYFEPCPRKHWVVTDFPCVLLQRTTAKEQNRRLIAAELPSSFIEQHGAVVIENHLNMIKPLNGAPKVRPALLAALLNCEGVDQAFRCISGSVAVSAYELNALPLPSMESLHENQGSG